jgi:hypothetical protein
MQNHKLIMVRNFMAVMNQKMDELISDKFGFRRYEEAAARLEIHLPDPKFGLIVDVHMVFGHLHSGTDKTVPNLQQLIKIDMTDMSQGVAVII